MFNPRYICFCSSADPGTEENAASSLALTQALQADFGTTFAQNQSILGGLTSTLKNAIAKPQGFSPTEMAALKTQAMDTTAQQFAGAKAGAAAGAARYGGDVASGVTAQTIGAVAGLEAETTSSQLGKINIASAEEQRANYWKGIQGLTQVGAAYNPTGYAGAAIGASEATTKAEAEKLAEKQSSWSNDFGVVKGIAGLGLAAATAGTGGAAKAAAPAAAGAMSSTSDFESEIY